MIDGDALHVDRVGVDLGLESEARQDRELVGGVEALDVESRIGLRIAQALGVREAFLEGQAFELHARKDVIAGAVQNSVKARNGLPGRASRRVLMIGMPPATDASNASATPLSSARRARATPCLRQQCLVGGHHVLAGAQRGLDDLPRHPLRAADQLDHAIDLVGDARAPADRRTSDRPRGRTRDPSIDPGRKSP